MKLPTILDTTAWASCQSRIFAGQAKPVEAYSYHGLFLMQSAICPTNLVCRQQVIYGQMDEAIETLNALRHNGYFSEGYSYMLYVKEAFKWAGNIPSAFEEMEANYALLIAPDGSLPMPEVR